MIFSKAIFPEFEILFNEEFSIHSIGEMVRCYLPTTVDGFGKELINALGDLVLGFELFFTAT